MRDSTRKGIFFILLLAGLAIMNFPFFMHLRTGTQQRRALESAEKSMKEFSQEEKGELLGKAKEYNRKLAEEQVQVGDAFAGQGESRSEEDLLYQETLNPWGDGLMGGIEIPGIDLQLPIYHGTSPEILEKGAGHLQGTSLPVGGASTHAVLSSHRGLPTSTLFTNLDQLEKGDKFFIHILDEVYAYQVEDIHTVLPQDTQLLQIQKGEDRVTLVTCTPYGINTHRLLVQGVRIPWEEEEEVQIPERNRWMKYLFILSVIVVLAAGKCLLFPGRAARRRGGK